MRNTFLGPLAYTAAASIISSLFTYYFLSPTSNTSQDVYAEYTQNLFRVELFENYIKTAAPAFDLNNPSNQEILRRATDNRENITLTKYKLINDTDRVVHNITAQIKNFKFGYIGESKANLVIRPDGRSDAFSINPGSEIDIVAVTTYAAMDNVSRSILSDGRTIKMVDIQYKADILPINLNYYIQQYPFLMYLIFSFGLLFLILIPFAVFNFYAMTRYKYYLLKISDDRTIKCSLVALQFFRKDKPDRYRDIVKGAEELNKRLTSSEPPTLGT